MVTGELVRYMRDTYEPGISIDEYIAFFRGCQRDWKSEWEGMDEERRRNCVRISSEDTIRLNSEFAALSEEDLRELAQGVIEANEE